MSGNVITGTDVEVLKDSTVKAFDEIEAKLDQVELDYGSIIVDVSDQGGENIARLARRDLVSFRVNVESVRRTQKAPFLEGGKWVDDVARRVTAVITRLETKFDGPLKKLDIDRAAEKKAKEEERQKRADHFKGMIAEIVRIPIIAAKDTKLESLRSALVSLKAMPMVGFEEYTEEAQQAFSQAAVDLQDMIGQANLRDAEIQRLLNEKKSAEEAEKVKEAERLRVREEDRKAALKDKADQEAIQAKAKAETLRIDIIRKKIDAIKEVATFNYASKVRALKEPEKSFALLDYYTQNHDANYADCLNDFSVSSNEKTFDYEEFAGEAREAYATSKEWLSNAIEGTRLHIADLVKLEAQRVEQEQRQKSLDDQMENLAVIKNRGIDFRPAFVPVIVPTVEKNEFDPELESIASFRLVKILLGACRSVLSTHSEHGQGTAAVYKKRMTEVIESAITSAISSATINPHDPSTEV